MFFPLSELGEGGIIYISPNDPYSILTGGYVGFYITSTSTGKNKTLVTLFNRTTLEHPSWSSYGTTLEQALSNALISHITVRPMTKVPSSFRTCICRLNIKEESHNAVLAFLGHKQTSPGDTLVANIIAHVGPEFFMPARTLELQSQGSADSALHKSKEQFDLFMSTLGDWLWKYPETCRRGEICFLDTLKKELETLPTRDTPLNINISTFFPDLPSGVRAPVIVTTDQVETQNLYLKDIDRLSDLSTEELISIAKALNDRDSRYDDLRQRVANQLILRQV